MSRLWLVGLVLFAGHAATHESLRLQIETIAQAAHGKVSVACSLPGSPLDCDVHPDARPPMQSVFKLPLALTILHQVEQGKFRLDQPIHFRPDDRILPHAVSTLQDRFPQANVDVPLQQLLHWNVTLSDNVAADILLRLAGGARAVDDYVTSLGIQGFHLVDGERALHRDESLQYRNWLEPRAAVQLLRRLSDDSPLTPEHTRLLLGWMQLSPLTTRLAGDLPAGTVVAHKTGTSDVVHGLAAATNDIGLIRLPDGRQLALAVFVTDATAPDAARDRVIARIARVIYDAAVATPAR